MSGTDAGGAGGVRAGEEFGVLEHGDQEVTLRFVRWLPHPPGKVWRALTEPEHLAAWFPTTVEGELAAGSGCGSASGRRRRRRSTGRCWHSIRRH